MTIEREGKFFVDHDLKGRPSIGMDSRKLSVCVAEAIRRRAYGVFGNPEYHFKETNLDFLKDLPRIQKIWFFDINLKNVDGIYALKQLKEFGVHPKRPPIRFELLPTLEFAEWQYKDGDSGMATLRSLKDLGLAHYNPKSASFEGLELPPNLVELGIAWVNPRTLAGLPKLIHLKKLVIGRCRNLETLKDLPIIAPNLQRLEIESCGRLAHVEQVIRRLPKLRKAFLDEKVLLDLPELPARSQQVRADWN